MEEPSWQMHLSCAENYAEQLLDFLSFSVVGRILVKLNHALDNIRWEVPFEVLLDVLLLLDWVGNRVEVPLLRKIPNDDAVYSMFEKSTGQTPSTLPSHGIGHV